MKDLTTERSWHDDSSERRSSQIDQIVEQIVARQHAGEQPQIHEYLQLFPQLEGEIREVWSVLMMVDMLSPNQQSHVSLGPIDDSKNFSFRSPVDSRLPEETSLSTPAGSVQEVAANDNAAFIGRYRIQRPLGRGGFGTVYLASDTELDRLVAIKLAHPHRMASDAARRSYLLEARTLAKLDHPNIVPVFDFGMMSDGRCFVVSKYVDGQDLAQLLPLRRFKPAECAVVVSTIAQALQCVHQAMVVHRDIKPANILVGHDQRIYVADFGLALAESTIDEKAALLGTPSYMSPEQIRREGHRIDGRSDQFSLGVVMYELLTGTRPFQGGSVSEIMRAILSQDPVPPSQVSPAIPRELSRICIKLLSKLATDRYASMSALAEDLLRWKELESINDHWADDHPNALSQISTQKLEQTSPSSTTSAAALVIPRGLRAYSSKDAYFFLDLMPGVRDRDGIPETLSHWKNWVQTDDYLGGWNRVGVISGPTGCGKSSMVRAGLIPLLGPQVTKIIVEATPDLTEKTIIAQLERYCDVPTGQSLPEMIMEIRRGKALPAEKKLLIIIDQFEQWLHGNPDPLKTELLQAVRQCDGRRVQCLVLIRDDFWLALSRFMKAAETPLQLGRNAVMVDLFDPRHATKVLIEFGRGYGALPTKATALTRDQERFIEGAIQSLLVQNKVIPVQLSLFAEMVKNRDWNVATLQRLGGSVGIGSQFLSESFSATYAPANQRIHAEAARAVLKSMLPTAGTDIKACRRSLEEIRKASGYVDPDAFQSLMSILESDLKLITATDSFDVTRTDSASRDSEPITYQLSHDFLVPSIRDWLSSQQKQTWRGRIEQAITQQAEYWSLNRQRRFLPSFWEWLQAWCLVPRHRLSPIEQEMLRARDRLSLIQVFVIVTILLLGTWLTQRLARNWRVDGLIARLQIAEASQVTPLLQEIDQFGALGTSKLLSALDEAEAGSRQDFLLRLGQVKANPAQRVEILDYALHQAELPEVSLACVALAPYSMDIASLCWKIIESAEQKFALESPQQQVTSDDTQLRALVLLAALDPGSSTVTDANRNQTDADDASHSVNQWNRQWLNRQHLDPQRWTRHAATATKIAVRAAAHHPSQYTTIVESLQPISKHLLGVLEQNVGHPTYDSQSFSALSLLRDFTRTDPGRQTRQCLHASKWQRPFIIPSEDRLVTEVLKRELAVAQSPTTDQSGQPEHQGLRRAMAATLLLKIDNADLQTWDVLRRTGDLTSRSLVIQLASELRVPIRIVERQLLIESDPGILAALVQMIGTLAEQPSQVGQVTASRIVDLYREHADGGVHSSARWCLTQWNDLATIASLARSTPEQNQAGPEGDRKWLVTPSGNLMLKIPGKLANNIGRDYLISAHEVTIDQFHAFTPGRYFSQDFGPAGDCPANIIKWKDAVEYCNWLSQREGLKAFYPNNPEELVTWQPTEADLAGTGYRLPQEEEWEYAARAGTTTDRPFGQDVDLLVKYDWCQANGGDFNARHRPELQSLYADPAKTRSKPVGQLLPNEYGLFDLLGNVAEWCNDLNPYNRVERAVRGGASAGTTRYLTVNRIGTAQPNEEFNSNGFRIVRTLP